MADDRQAVHQGPALPDPGVRRVESKARTAGYVSEADLASVDADIRADIEAADAAALQAAIDAASTSEAQNAETVGEVGVYEAQFGSVAVGRLAAGTLTVAFTIGAGGEITAGGGAVTLGSGGIYVAPGSDAANRINLGAASLRLINDSLEVSSPGDVFVTAGQSGGADVVIQASPTFPHSVDLTGYKINLDAGVGGVRVDGDLVATKGSRTTGNPTWANGDGRTGGALPSAATSTVDGHYHSLQHEHQVADHTHTVTI